MNWGKWIVVSFVLFAVFIGALVGVCVNQDINLVSKNYYPEELAYEKQIERINNSTLLAERPSITISGNVLEIQFSQFNLIKQGELKLFRPSDVRLDKQFVVEASDGVTQHFDLSTLPKGMYRARMKWSMGEKEYYIENVINL